MKVKMRDNKFRIFRPNNKMTFLNRNANILLFKKFFLFSIFIFPFYQMQSFYNSAFGQDRLAVISEAINDVKVQHEGQWLAVKMVGQRIMNSSLFEGDVLETGADSSVNVLYADGTLIKIKENSSFSFRVRELSDKEKAQLGKETGRTLKLEDGKLWGSITPSKTVLTEFETSSGIGSIRGTEVGVRHDASTKTTGWELAKGLMRFASRAGSMNVKTVAGEIGLPPGSIASVGVNPTANKASVHTEAGEVAFTTKTGRAALKAVSGIAVTVNPETGRARIEVTAGEMSFTDTTTGHTKSVKKGETVETMVEALKKTENRKEFREMYGRSIPKNINDSLHNLALFDASKIFNQSFGALSPYLNATQKALQPRVNQQDPINSIAKIDPGIPNLNVSQQCLANNAPLRTPFDIILRWGAMPSDLDLHLFIGSDFHVYYADRGSLVSPPYAALNQDVTTGFGPETITVSQFKNETYTYLVHDYSNRLSSNSVALSNSGANIQLIDQSRLTRRYNITPNQGGTLWTVLSINGSTGRITPINSMSYSTRP